MAQPQASFQGVGFPPGTRLYDTLSVVLSGNGQWLGGTVARDNPLVLGGWEMAGFRWRDGIFDYILGNPHPANFGPQVRLQDFSFDGGTAIGEGWIGPTVEELFYWTSSGGFGGFAGFPEMGNGSYWPHSNSLSNDGLAAAGVYMYRTPTGSGPDQAFRWTATSGFTDLGWLTGSPPSPTGTGGSRAQDISGDGFVVVGGSVSLTSVWEAFRWQSGSMVRLGFLPGHNVSNATSTNADGSAVVGWSIYETPAVGMLDAKAFYWTPTTGMQQLPQPAGFPWGEAFDVSQDGLVVVGDFSGTPSGKQPAVWSPAWGPRTLQEILEAFGVTSHKTWIRLGEITGVAIYTDAISGKQMVAVVGLGVSRSRPVNSEEPWIARFPLDFSVLQASQLQSGLPVSGTPASTQWSDNSRWSFAANLLQDDVHPIRIVISGTSALSTPRALEFKIESSADSAGRFETVELFDFSKNRYQNFGMRVVGPSDSFNIVTVGKNAWRFVHPTSGEVRARLSWYDGLAELTTPVRIGIDQAVWKFSP